MKKPGYGKLGPAARNAPAKVVMWCDHGQESFHPELAEFWLPEHIKLEGDWDDFESLKSLSDWLDEYDLRVNAKISRFKGSEDQIYVVPDPQ